jgi:hypothetical protein
MPVVGAVLNLSTEPHERESALAHLRSHPSVTLGDHQARGYPLVIEFDCKSQEKAIWEEIQSIQGVMFSSVVFADFSDLVSEEIV